jgi:FkbM family methyltransferase
MARDVEIADGDERYRFRCASYREMSRCMNLFTKEEGTCTWIREQVRPGEVFYDVGANIGIYTVMAGRQVGASGRVLAFEPHSPTFACLIQNILANDLEDVVSPCNFALSDREGHLPFNYQSSAPGSSDSQLDSRTSGSGEAYTPQIAEFKYATTIDRLLADGAVAPPDHVKIDVDGNELLILRGMAGLMTGDKRPKSMQVEINLLGKEDLFAFMEAQGYRLALKHYTRAGQRRIDAGGDPEAYAYNAIFEPNT